MTVIAERMLVADPDPLQAGPMHEGDEERWRQFITSNVNPVDGYSEVYRAWTDPRVNNPTIRSRLVALLIYPKNIPSKVAMGVSASFGGSLRHIFIHKVDGENTPRDLPALLDGRPELARELFMGVRHWRGFPEVLCDYDRQKFNYIVGATKPYVGGLALAHELDDIPMIDRLVGKGATYDDVTEASVPKTVTPWTYGGKDDYRAKHDPYNDLAIELQSRETSPERAGKIIDKWFRIVEKQEKSNIHRYDYNHGIGRLEEHGIDLAEDPQGDKARLMLVVTKMLNRRDRLEHGTADSPSESSWLSSKVALQIPDVNVRARLMSAIVLHKTTDRRPGQVNKIEIYTYRIKNEADREAAAWYLSHVQLRRKRWGEIVIAETILETAIGVYDESQAERARKDAVRRATLLAGRTVLYGEIQPRLF